MKNKAKRIICAAFAFAMALGIAAAMPMVALASDASSIVSQIIRFNHGGIGKLSASESGGTVTVVGEVTNVVNTLELSINKDVRVVWEASYSALDPRDRSPLEKFPTQNGRLLSSFDLIMLTEGSDYKTGEFVIAESGLIASKGNGHAIHINASAKGMRVDVRGEVSAMGKYSAIEIEAEDAIVNVNDGTVSGTGNTPVINALHANAAITVSGGEVSAEIGNAIFAEGEESSVTVSGGTVSCETGSAIEVSGADSVVEVKGSGEVRADEGNAIFSSGARSSITVSGGMVSVNSVSGKPVILIIGDFSDIHVSGGEVTSENGSSIAICTNCEQSKITVSGGTVSSESSTAVGTSGAKARVVVSGGTVSSESGITIDVLGLDSIVEVRNGTVKSKTGFAIFTSNENSTITSDVWYTIGISGGEVSSESGNAIHSESKFSCIEVSGGAVSSKTGNAIWIMQNSVVSISGGTVSSESGTAIWCDGTYCCVIIDGSAISANGAKSTIEAHGTGCEVRVIEGGAVENTGTGIAISVQGENSIVSVNGTVNANTGMAISASASTVMVTGGTINSEPGIAESVSVIRARIFNMYGGMVSSENGIAVVATVAATIRGGIINSENHYAIAILHYGCTVEINGGTISSKNRSAIHVKGLMDNINIEISGGVISSETRHAIDAGSNKYVAVNVIGGFVFAHGAEIFSHDAVNAPVIYVGFGGTCNIAGNSVVCAWDKPIGNASYKLETSEDLLSGPVGATAKWTKNDAHNGISYNNGTNSGFFPVGGITLSIGVTVSKPDNFELVPKPDPFERFIKAKLYELNLFDDVDEHEWYGFNNSKSIATAYEYGLMQGSGNAKFNPAGNITIAEAVTIAARVRSIYEADGEAFASSGGEWHQVYVAYAVANGIIDAGDFSDYGREATRAEMAYIFSRSLPADAFAMQNNVKFLPDVGTGTPYADAIFMLYGAGILAGNDSAGTFMPDNKITRAEAAAIISRVILTETRFSEKSFG